MPANALFFPYIALPDDAWTTKALLYWDRLSSIVPRDHLHRPEQMSPFMRDLLTEGLVVPVIPGRYIRQIPRFDESFIELIEARLRRSRRREFLGLPMRRMDAENMSLIHAEKLGEIPDFLVKVGLARRVDWNWFDIESTTTNLFMAYLAACLGAVPDVNATPVTNQLAIARHLMPKPPQLRVDRVDRQRVRDVILRQLLPVPAERIDLATLVKFKHQHGVLLQRFRTTVEAECTRIAALPAADRIEASDAFLQACRQEIDEIKEAMQPSFGRVVLGALMPLAAAGAAVQAVPPGQAVASWGAAASLLVAIYTAVTSIQGPRTIQNRPLAYVAHARSTFGLVERRPQTRPRYP